MHHSPACVSGDRAAGGSALLPQPGKEGGEGGGLNWPHLQENQGTLLESAVPRFEIRLSGDGDQLPTGFCGLSKASSGICNAFLLLSYSLYWQQFTCFERLERLLKTNLNQSVIYLQAVYFKIFQLE